MKTLLAILLVMLCLNSIAQKGVQKSIDSLEQRLNNLKPGDKKIHMQQRLSFLWLNIDPKKTLIFATTGLGDAERLKKDSDACVFMDFIGEAYFYIENFKVALNYLQQDYDLAGKIGCKYQMGLALADMSGIYQNESNYTLAQNCSFKALSIFEQLKDYRLMGISNLNIGVVYNNNNDFKKAIFYAKRALQITKKNDNTDAIPEIYDLLASAYNGLGNNIQARIYCGYALKIYEEKKNDYGRATVLFLLCTYYPGDYPKQIELGLKCMQLWNKVSPENYYAINNLGNLGSIYGHMAIGEKSFQKRAVFFKEARAYLTKAIDLAKKTNTKSVIIDFSDSLSVINAAMGDYKNAYSNLKTSSTLYDSVFSQDNKNKIASLESKHELDLKNKQLVINQLEIANQTKQRGFLVAGLLTMLIIAGLIYYQSVQRRKSNTTLLLLNNELDEANKAKTKFFSILNHDLRRPVASFITFLNLQQMEPGLISGSGYVTHSKRLTSSAENLLETMEDLLLWSKGQMENFKPLLKNIAAEDMFSYIGKLFDDAPAKLKFEPAAGIYIYTDEHYLKTIMQNLTGNAIKATGAVTHPLITWNAWRTGTTVNLSIWDNGPGATPEQIKPLFDHAMPVGIKNGLGLHIVRDLAKAINCTLKVDHQIEGMKIILSFSNDSSQG